MSPREPLSPLWDPTKQTARLPCSQPPPPLRQQLVAPTRIVRWQVKACEQRHKILCAAVHCLAVMRAGPYADNQSSLQGLRALHTHHTLPLNSRGPFELHFQDRRVRRHHASCRVRSNRTHVWAFLLGCQGQVWEIMGSCLPKLSQLNCVQSRMKASFVFTTLL